MSETAIHVDVTVCARCGKPAVLRTREWEGRGYRPIDGKMHQWECPDGCDASLTRSRFVPEVS